MALAIKWCGTFSHGWTPEKKFSRHRWNRNYSEAIILYALALGSPSHAVEPLCYLLWNATFETTNIYDIESLHAGPLFIHQMAHQWIDFRGIQDRFNTETAFDYFENSKSATYIQRQCAVENPKQFADYGRYCWGLTASNGPGPARRSISGVKRVIYNYKARGVPQGPDDGTISPWAVVASLPFAPDIVLETIQNMIQELGAQGLG